MELEILKQRDMPLLDRQRIVATLNFEAGPTPSILQLKDLLADALHVDKTLLSIRHVYQRFGEPKAKVIVHVYKNRKDLERLEKIRKSEKPPEATKKEGG